MIRLSHFHEPPIRVRFSPAQEHERPLEIRFDRCPLHRAVRTAIAVHGRRIWESTETYSQNCWNRRRARSARAVLVGRQRRCSRSGTAGQGPRLCRGVRTPASPHGTAADRPRRRSSEERHSRHPTDALGVSCRPAGSTQLRRGHRRWRGPGRRGICGRDRASRPAVGAIAHDHAGPGRLRSRREEQRQPVPYEELAGGLRRAVGGDQRRPLAGNLVRPRFSGRVRRGG